MRATILGVAAAILLHAAVLLFGGILFPKPEQGETAARVENVDLVAETGEKKDEKPQEDPDEPEAEEPMETASERPPDARDLEILQAQAAAAAVPELAALSLGALEDALAPGAGGDGGFGGAFSLVSGGRIGGTGAPGSAVIETPGAANVFALPDLDQRPRPIFQAEPVYPFELRQKKIEGTVYVQFVVDQEGRVVEPQVEKSTHSAFDKPALDAVRQWRFEPAVRDGRRVQARLRVPIRFQKG